MTSTPPWLWETMDWQLESQDRQQGWGHCAEHKATLRGASETTCYTPVLLHQQLSAVEKPLLEKASTPWAGLWCPVCPSTPAGCWGCSLDTPGSGSVVGLAAWDVPNTSLAFQQPSATAGKYLQELSKGNL